MTGLSILAPFVATRPRPEVEHCELCGAPLPEKHRHVVELAERRLSCACHACGILFGRGDTSARFRTVPERVLADPAFAMTPARWAELGIPVGLAFFFASSRLGRHVACYPGPAGVTEAELAPEAWEALEAVTSLAGALQPDVEALLVHGERGAPVFDCYLIPIDAAYELAGRLRRSWRGFSGGEEARRELAAFFAELERRSGGRR
jgi:hypothetical protein